MGRTREHLWVSLVVVAVAATWFLVTLQREGAEAEDRVHYERAALERLRQVAAAEIVYHTAHGRYSWLGALDLPSAEVPGYRIDVLLPYAMSTKEFVQIAPEKRGRVSDRLVKMHFAVVARPWGEGVTGHRSFYVDESNEVLVSEGVAAPGAGVEGPLPEVHVTQSDVYDTGRLRWHRLDELPRR